jgi:hypothetical protein
VVGGEVPRRILEAIDGQRTLAEMLLHARSSEYQVTRLLFELHRQGLIRVKKVRRAPAGVGDAPAGVGRDGIGHADAAPADGPGSASSRDLSAEIGVAQGLLSRGEPDAALAVLYATARAFPGVPTVRQLIAKAESAYVESVSREIHPGKIPMLLNLPDETARESLPPSESYLLSLIDGRSDLKSILWVAPMRALDVFRAIAGLRSRGIIDLRDPGGSPLPAPST